MSYDPRIHNRRSTRLSSWDYSWPGWYYVTVVVRGHRCVSGMVKDNHVNLSDLGRAAENCWLQIPLHHSGIEQDEFVIMPNHFHGTIIINNQAEICRDVQLNVPTDNSGRLFPSRKEVMGALSPKKDTLSVIIRTFKAAVTTWARNNGFEDFAWQSRFHDHIIRNEGDLHRIRTYIANNPLQWAIDEENPESKIL